MSLLLQQAEDQLQLLLEGTAIDERRLDRILHAARNAREQSHDFTDLEQLLSAPLVGATVDEADALAALQQLLGAAPTPAVAPLATDVPPPRSIDLSRPAPPEPTQAPEHRSEAAAIALEPHDTDRGDAPISTSPAAPETTPEVPSEPLSPAPTPPPPSTVEVAALFIDEDAPASDQAAAPASESMPPASEADGGQSGPAEPGGQEDQAFAESLFAAASAVSRREDARRNEADFDYSETGEHESVGQPPHGTAPDQPAVDEAPEQEFDQDVATRATDETLQKQAMESLDDDEVELLDDEFIESIEEVSEITSSASLAPFSPDDPTMDSGAPESLAAEEMPTLPEIADSSPSTERPPQPPTATEPAEERGKKSGKKRRRKKTSKLKPRSGLFKRLIGKDDK